jgi:hypothetical protein
MLKVVATTGATGGGACVTTFSADSTGLTPNVATSGAVTLGGTLLYGYGGTSGNAVPTAGAVAYGNGTAYNFTSAGTAGQYLQSSGNGSPVWTTISSNSISVGNTVISGGTSGYIVYNNAGVVGEKATTGNGNVVLANAATITNVTVSSVASTFPNSFLANSSTTLGNTTLTLGSSATTVGNLSLGNANLTSVAATFPNSYLANSSTTLGNATLTLGSTQTAVGNLTLNNANITSVAVKFPNSFIANVTTTLGNTTLTLGSTTTSVGNLTLANATIVGGTINVSTSNVTANTTSNATFATSSLLLVPAGYIVVDLNGTNVKVPYYAV